jgi:hypothetical protein
MNMSSFRGGPVLLQFGIVTDGSNLSGMLYDRVYFSGSSSLQEEPVLLTEDEEIAVWSERIPIRLGDQEPSPIDFGRQYMRPSDGEGWRTVVP